MFRLGASSLCTVSLALALSCGGDPPPSDDDDDGASAGGGGGASNEACDTYIDCVAASSPAVLSDVLAAYGMDGSCWQQLPAEQCRQACADGTAMLQAAFPDQPACGGGQGGGGQGGGGQGGGGQGGGGQGGSCVPAANGWPTSQLPAGYAGTGYAVGDQAPVFIGADQNGSTDVSLAQFYGNMLVVAFHTGWNGPSNQAASSAESLRNQLNGSYGFWIIDILLEGDNVGQPSQPGDASDWANTYGLTYPVLSGQSAYDLGSPYNIMAVPTYVILDPGLRIRDIIMGYPGDPALTTAVNAARDAFLADNPGWTPPCP